MKWQAVNTPEATLLSSSEEQPDPADTEAVDTDVHSMAEGVNNPLPATSSSQLRV